MYAQGQDLDLPERIEYIHEAPLARHATGVGTEFRHGLTLGPDMYSRILIPNYFEGRVFYVDVDCLVLNNFSHLWEMDLKGNPTGCVYRPDIGWKGGHRHDDMGSGTFLCDIDAWRKENILDKIYDVMELERQGKIREFGMNVESALSYVHDGKFLHLPKEFQILTYYGTLVQPDYIAHFAGPKPWNIDRKLARQRPLYFKALWEAYFYNKESLIERETNNLPSKRNEQEYKKLISKLN